MLRAAYGLESPPVGELSRQDVRAHEAVMRLLGELRGWSELDGPVSPEELVAALERAEVLRAAAGEPGRVAVIDLLRARTRRFEIVFLLGLEEGRLPRRGHESPFLADDARRELDERSRARLARPDQAARDRYLFYTACTRATQRVYLVREAAGDDGSPREASPFWEEVQALFPRDDVTRWTRRRPLSQLTWPLEAAPTERERLRATALLAAGDSDTAEAVAAANGWQRQLARALSAFDRPTRLTHPAVLAELGARGMFGVTELERFADCSSIWFLERVIDPRSIDAQLGLPLVPRRFEVSFGTERTAPELQRGFELASGVMLGGKIYRIDVDPFSARGIVQDYKSGKTGHSAAQIESELKLQIPLYMLVLRDLVGVEPLGGVYRPLSGERKARGLLRAEARDAAVPGFVKNDYLDEESFWGQVERSSDLAVSLVRRLQGGDVKHDPKSGDCPT